MRAYTSGTLTLPNVGGSPDAYSTFAFDDLKARDSEETIDTLSYAGGYGWLFQEGDERIFYRGEDIWEDSCSAFCDSDTVSPWTGYFIYANQDDVDILRRNT
ncbi:MAG: hypothetical protein JXN61_12915 [Sedimentisphaerales bacterium]|nr:hypothetical protein [Sedimentisphaerales bacterium]